MKMEVLKGDVWIIEDEEGVTVIPDQVVLCSGHLEDLWKKDGHEGEFNPSDLLENRREDLEMCFGDFCSGNYQSIEIKKDVWYGRNSASGYMDCTDWDWDEDRFALNRTLNWQNGVEDLVVVVAPCKSEIILDENSLVTSAPKMWKLLYSADLAEWQARTGKFPGDEPIDFDDLDWTYLNGEELHHVTEKGGSQSQVISIGEVDVAKILSKTITDPTVIDCLDNYLRFMEDVGKLLADHFGGDFLHAACSEDGLNTKINIKMNDCVPNDGGIYRDFGYKGEGL
jgi:hypothetical protein